MRSDRLSQAGKIVSALENGHQAALACTCCKFEEQVGQIGKVSVCEKQLAQRIIPELESEREPPLHHDSSTNNLINHYRKFKEAL